MKQKYLVFARDVCDYGDGRITEGNWRKLGETYAVSKNKAISNIKFRLNRTNDFCEWMYDGERRTEYKSVAGRPVTARFQMISPLLDESLDQEKRVELGIWCWKHVEKEN